MFRRFRSLRSMGLKAARECVVSAGAGPLPVPTSGSRGLSCPSPTSQGGPTHSSGWGWGPSPRTPPPGPAHHPTAGCAGLAPHPARLARAEGSEVSVRQRPAMRPPSPSSSTQHSPPWRAGPSVRCPSDPAGIPSSGLGLAFLLRPPPTPFLGQQLLGAPIFHTSLLPSTPVPTTGCRRHPLL